MAKAINQIEKIHIPKQHNADQTLREEMKKLTGCSHVYVVEGRCDEPGCHNNADIMSADSPYTRALGEAFGEIPKPIINARPRKWCVL